MQSNTPEEKNNCNYEAHSGGFKISKEDLGAILINSLKTSSQFSAAIKGQTIFGSIRKRIITIKKKQNRKLDYVPAYIDETATQ